MDGMPRGEVLDAIMSPRAANPLCWTTILVERDRAAGTYTLRRGTIGVTSRGCSAGWAYAWAPADTQSLTGLRRLAAANCWVNAWLRFGRAPYMRGGRIADYRFGGRGRETFRVC